MNYLYKTYTSSNPAGVQINLGVYALVECICTRRKAETALWKWCGVKETDNTKRKEKNWKFSDGSKTEKILQIYTKNKELSRSDIAKLADSSCTMVSIALKRLGVTKSNRWEGYISKDKRYSKNKRGK